MKTVFEINDNYWSKDEFPMQVTRIEYTPIQNAATQVAALLSGEVDFIQDVPVQDLARVASADKRVRAAMVMAISRDAIKRIVMRDQLRPAAVGMLAQIGVTVNLDAKPKAQHFPLINNLAADFYMLGWGVPTYDSEYIFNFLVHTKGEKYGSWNGTRYSNDDLDGKIVALASETDLPKRNSMIADIWSTVQDEVLYIPIHHQVLS